MVEWAEVGHRNRTGPEVEARQQPEVGKEMTRAGQGPQAGQQTNRDSERGFGMAE